MGVAPVKIISVVILSFEVVLMSTPNIIIVTKKVNKQGHTNVLFETLNSFELILWCLIPKVSIQNLIRYYGFIT